MQNVPELGKLITSNDERRDAVHIAVAPVRAACFLNPGEHVGPITTDAQFGEYGPTNNSIGIVDPFLKGVIPPGQRFWLFLYPGTITSLRHVWSHPAFGIPLPRQTDSKE